MRRVILLVAGIVVAVLAANAAQAAENSGERWALLIGINNYQRMGDLKYCRQDAEALGKVLVEEAGFPVKRVRVMSGGAAKQQDKPTLGNLRSRIRQFTDFPGKNDTLLVFFAGHGVMIGDKGCLMPSDGDKADAHTVVELDWIKQQLSKCKAKNKLLVLDMCRPGSGRGVETIAPSLAKAANMVVLTSCAKGQTSYEDDKAGHGVFSGHLIAGLSGAADKNKDKTITQLELFSYVRSEVTDWSVDEGKTQTPKMYPEKGQADVAVAELRKGPPFPLARKPPEDAQGENQVYAKWPFDLKEAKRRQEETAKAMGIPVEKGIDLGNGIRLVMVLVPAGEFVMGSPSTEPGRGKDEVQHRVRITRPFYLGRDEVTQEQWEWMVGTRPSFFKGKTKPVEQVSWHDCVRLVKKLNALGKGSFRLPTEAEWEYACRAGAATAFSSGRAMSPTHANCSVPNAFQISRRAEFRGTTTIAGTFAENSFGLRDMHGNVWEWCADWYGEYPVKACTDPKGPIAGKKKILRGGSWNKTPSDLRSASRFGCKPSHKSHGIGVRVLLDATVH